MRNMDPVIEEMSRSKPPILRRDVWMRWVAHLRTVVQPRLDRLAALEAAQDAEPVRRGPGRPPKVQSADEVSA